MIATLFFFPQLEYVKSMSWNRTYRPRKVSDLHLTNVRDYFTSLLEGKYFPQVFLFTGPKGTGKTSTARIIGALLNDVRNEATVNELFFKKVPPTKPLLEPKAKAPELETIFSGQSYLVQEMDAASNRGIDDIRALKERVQLPPVQGMIAVYILDEVHMLTTEAFNALLKLLEEPPPHVVFILATTDVQKVPETVLSRCQVVKFTLATQAELTTALKNVCSSEKLSFPIELLNIIATQANGSFRDAIKLLEQAVQQKVTSIEELQQKFGLNYQASIQALATAVLGKDSKQVAHIFQDLRLSGAHEAAFHRDLVQYFHSQLMIALGLLEGTATIPMEAARFLLQEISSSELSLPSPLSFLRLELKLLDVIERARKKSKVSEVPPPAAGQKTQSINKSGNATSPSEVPKRSASLVEEIAVTEEIEILPPLTTVTTSSSSADADAATGDGQQLYQEWPSFVSQVAQTNFSLATLLRSAHPVSGDTGELTLSVYYKFHQEQLQQPKFTQQLNMLISDTYGGPVKINCILTDQPTQAELTEPNLNNKLEKLAVDALM